jgi:hypothetical protein
MAGRPVKHGSQIAEEYEVLALLRRPFYFWIKKKALGLWSSSASVAMLVG